MCGDLDDFAYDSLSTGYYCCSCYFWATMVDCTNMSCCGRDSIVTWSTWFSKLAGCGVGSVVMDSSSGPGEELEEDDVWTMNKMTILTRDCLV